MDIRKTIKDIKKRIDLAAPKVRLIMDPVPYLSLDEWEALSLAHHGNVFHNRDADEHP